MSAKPKISVVCPIYNRGIVVKHAIHGILDQSFQHWELIMVDDGSTDNTEQEIKRFSNVEPRIKYHQIPHSGKIGHVRNVGNQLATGQLIVVQDSDDISLPDRLQVLWDEFQRTDADVLYHSVYHCFPFEQYQVTLRQFKKAEAFDKDRLLHTQYIPAQIATKREVALRVPYDPEINVSDDWLWLLELALNDCTWHHTERALYEYYFSPDSANIAGEKDGRRDVDMKHIKQVLKDKYNILVTRHETKDAQGNIIKAI